MKIAMTVIQELSRGHSISGKDPYFPWFSLGEDTGFEMIRLEEPFTSGDQYLPIYV